jgi:hypothetical protein
VVIRKIEYLGYPNCVELGNGTVTLIISTDFGPRILFYGFDGGENILGWHGEASVNTELGTWKPYGGHRLWLAPENMPLSYSPDNAPVGFIEDGEFSLRLIPPEDIHANIQKELTVSLDDNGSGATLDHKITKRGDTSIEASAWALTIMRPGGTAIVPNEPFEPYGPTTLLPVRTMTLWPYTDFTDPRWSFEKDEIRLRVDEQSPAQQKFGVLNRQGWAGYEWRDLRFVKRFDFDDGASYPDMNSNIEIYTAGGFVEVETLSPLRTIAPNDSVTHQERWELQRSAP